jgi:ParB family chromosome partitioning protein
MEAVVSVKPFRCRMWTLHDRLDEYVNEATCQSEIESFRRHGQLIPVLGRRLQGDPDYDVELAYGARRLFVARHLNVPLMVELRDLSDMEALVAMDVENRHRKDLSPYERGRSFASWLRAGFFGSQEDLARALRISASKVSRLVALARLPAVIVEAFGGPLVICEGWGIDLLRLWDNPPHRQSITRVARSIAGTSPRPTPESVYEQLICTGAGKGRRRRSSDHDEVVTNTQGRPLFRLRRQRKAIAFLLPADEVSMEVVGEIRESITAIIERAACSPGCERDRHLL